MTAGAVAWQRFTYPGGDIYEGEWSEEGRKHGYGMLVMTDGTKFVGKFMLGLCQGPGLLKFPDGSSYAGEFSEGKYNGYGTFTRSDGMKFEGEFKQGSIEGMGLITFPNGTHGTPRQEGEFSGNELLFRTNATEDVNKARASAAEAADIAKNIVLKTDWGKGRK
ncbi:predicted protein [Nematostella vectensis]|uniref:MORN repeat-containing protein 4 n=1 Tax=Nematostella vectensis TaxID=45351 RepID=A7RYL4_NEMVE|nr:MORN repeat-containing protein 4 [Nematostella vectensis]EDO43482.1 predicted protein [Nematostella vectensis]|eukprot:XP_001635545.1 predicted protein [Nematostella vectensis]